MGKTKTAGKSKKKTASPEPTPSVKPVGEAPPVPEPAPPPAPEAKPAPAIRTVMIELPIMPLEEGYTPAHIDVRLGLEQKQALRRVFRGLYGTHARLKNRTHVDNTSGVIKFIFEQVSDAAAAAEA